MPAVADSRSLRVGRSSRTLDNSPHSPKNMLRTRYAFNLLLKLLTAAPTLFDPKAWESLSHLHLHNKETEAALPDPVTKSIYTFDSLEQYASIYRAGAEFEVNLEKTTIDDFNAARNVFRTWVYRRLSNTDGKQHWLFAVEDKNLPAAFPKEGEQNGCLLALFSDPAGLKQVSREWPAYRIDNARSPLKEFIFFRVSFPSNVASQSILTPVVDESNFHIQGASLLTHANNMFSMLTLEHADPTSKAELEALEKLTNLEEGPAKDAFDWIRTFKDPATYVNLFEKLPHMRTAIDNPEILPANLRKMVAKANPQQLATYKEMLQRLPCGVGIIPGGPGGGKTFFNMLLTAMAQYQELKTEDGTRRVKILYLIDINSPVDDATNKCVKMSENFGDGKQIVRMFGWSREMKQGLKVLRKKEKTKCIQTLPLEEEKSEASQSSQLPSNALIADPTTAFVAMAAKVADNNAGDRFKSECLAPTLDQLAFRRFEAQKEQYSELEAVLEQYLHNNIEPSTMRILRTATEKLYGDTLEEVDFLAATPIAAVSLADGRFKPDIFRQTGCYVGSDKNPWEVQLKMSVMERAHYAGATNHELLMNHRAFATLHQMPSNLFYDAKMVTGHNADTIMPSPTKFICKWMEANLTSGSQVTIPRVLAHVRNANASTRVDSSFWNETHHAWTMQQAKKLLSNPNFVSVDGQSRPGTILIIAPYRQAVTQYKRAAGDLCRELSEAQGVPTKTMFSRLEVRSVDTVQGHEADFVFFDLVREKPTDFLDDDKRLAVATTRARQGEVYIMHPMMAKRLCKTENLYAIYSGCLPRCENGLVYNAHGCQGRYGQIAYQLLEREPKYRNRRY
ncbi:uncharacterized protein PpBr36_09414 [Pyricularia pennisetigena]|uniref:uncharacterized protein n=1 Tax=Pyricularia pennisetigena TaxID=1578925 RepID=UPI0011536D4A|nr:uncharacterized protein PpBr36_09414 [Pyricularia pennisetigena]TLS22018.1 hypothetical protein PpBr36_09414 [Pyricularia pennisetigena]